MTAADALRAALAVLDEAGREVYADQWSAVKLHAVLWGLAHPEQAEAIGDRLARLAAELARDAQEGRL